MTMKRFSFLLIAVFVISAMILPEAKPADDVFKLGCAIASTGKHKKKGEEFTNSLIMATEEFNAGGGFKKGPLKGKKLEWIFEDTESNDDKSCQLAEKFITVDKYPILFGFYSSGRNQKVIAEVADKYRIPFIVTGASANDITEKNREYLFRMTAIADSYSMGLEDFLLKIVKPKSMALVYEPTSYGKSQAGALKKFCEKSGIAVVYDNSYAQKATDFTPILLEVKRANPDVLALISYTQEAILLVKQIKELNINPKVIVGGTGFNMPYFAEQAGPLAEYIFTMSLWAAEVKYPGAREFVEKYKARYGEIPSYSAASKYATVSVITDALERAASLAPQDIMAALRETDLMTVYGHVRFENFDTHTQQLRTPTLLMQWQAGELVSVWPPDVAGKKYRYPVPKWSQR
ncbi:MAG: ABC transporter substrate-binding protein [Candidatus Omnitrophota bacterium]